MNNCGRDAAAVVIIVRPISLLHLKKGAQVCLALDSFGYLRIFREYLFQGKKDYFSALIYQADGLFLLICKFLEIGENLGRSFEA